jgi:hypothetical protein
MDVKMNPRAVTVCVSLCVLSFLAGFAFQPGNSSAQLYTPSASLTECVGAQLNLLKVARPDAHALSELAESCYLQIYRQSTLNDFQIRRTKFIQQAYDERILLWMVVAITLSGVLLAALQLIASYKLAEVNRGTLDQGGEIALERDRISLKSSVTGLVILVLSFAFFSIFVFEIYKIKEIAADAPAPQPVVQQQRVNAGAPTFAK